MASAEADEALNEAVRAALRSLAREGKTATYQELSLLAAAPPPHRIHKVTLALEALIREDHTAGRPLLASFAISKSRGGLPGRGFFKLLCELGRHDGTDDNAAFRKEFDAAQTYWRRG